MPKIRRLLVPPTLKFEVAFTLLGHYHNVCAIISFDFCMPDWQYCSPDNKMVMPLVSHSH